MSAVIPSVFLAPLLGSLLAFVVPRRAVVIIGSATATVTLAALLGLAVNVWSQGAARYAVGGWGAPLGIELHADGLSVAMLLTAGLVTLCVGAYALGFFAPSEQGASVGRGGDFWPLLLFLWAALNVLFLSADVFNLYVALELITVAAVALVTLAHEPAALPAALRYLLAAFLGSLAYLLGVAILYAAFDTLDLALLSERLRPNAASGSALALMTVGLALKSALFPFHFWLPRAHSIAPAPVSAALSALVVTASFYVLVRLWIDVFPSVATYGGAELVGVLGGAAVVWGSLQAIRQQRLKVAVAYSTVAQVGLLVLILPLIAGSAPVGGPEAAAGRAFAWSGGVYLAISHAFAKAAMFLAAGNVVHAMGDDRIAGIAGIASALPMSTYAFGIAGVSLVGIPPSGGFVAKWLLLLAAVENGQWWWAVTILLGSLLTAGYVFQVLTQEFSDVRREHRPPFSPVPRIMELMPLVLALAALLLGLRAAEPLLLLDIGRSFPTAADMGSPP